jgi:hypothetical protein
VFRDGLRRKAQAAVDANVAHLDALTTRRHRITAKIAAGREALAECDRSKKGTVGVRAARETLSGELEGHRFDAATCDARMIETRVRLAEAEKALADVHKRYGQRAWAVMPWDSPRQRAAG